MSFSVQLNGTSAMSQNFLKQNKVLSLGRVFWTLFFSTYYLSSMKSRTEIVSSSRHFFPFFTVLSISISLKLHQPTPVIYSYRNPFAGRKTSMRNTAKTIPLQSYLWNLILTMSYRSKCTIWQEPCFNTKTISILWNSSTQKTLSVKHFTCYRFSFPFLVPLFSRNNRMALTLFVESHLVCVISK